MFTRNKLSLVLLTTIMFCNSAQAAISIDRTRIVYPSSQNSISITVTNHNKNLPYLAQAWLEDEQGKKITTPLVITPPLQRVEAGKQSQIKIEKLDSAENLPKDRESIFYFNVREVPPKSDKPNTLQIALQTKVKLFYRPDVLVVDANETPWQNKLNLIKKGNSYTVKNPTGYYITIVDASNTKGKEGPKDFKGIMISPFGELNLGVTTAQVGNNPVLTYVNDYGARVELAYQCNTDNCNLLKDTK